ncbi:MAG: methyltransferase domain-containing protein [Candidatus ainarchaeum sp.]|nr:methyltransferase domain-containing protein [Candidatus ainarchaeum sp.]
MAVVKDQGKKFGLAKSKDFDTLYFKYNKKLLGLLVDKIKTKKPLIADYGGANSILGKELLNLLDKKKIVASIDNIDSDSKKFIKVKGIKNIKADFLKPLEKEKYDFAMSRHTLHYLNKKDQSKFLDNVYASLKPNGYFLLIMFVNSEDVLRKIKIKIEEYLKHKKNIYRQMFSDESFLDLAEKSKFKVIKTKKVNYTISINDFYKNRFNLSKTQVKEIEKTICKKHKESIVAVLLKKGE